MNNYLSCITLCWCSHFGKFFEDVIAHYIHPEKRMKKSKLSSKPQPFTNVLVFCYFLSIIEIRSNENEKNINYIRNVQFNWANEVNSNKRKMDLLYKFYGSSHRIGKGQRKNEYHSNFSKQRLS